MTYSPPNLSLSWNCSWAIVKERKAARSTAGLEIDGVLIQHMRCGPEHRIDRGAPVIPHRIGGGREDHHRGVRLEDQHRAVGRQREIDAGVFETQRAANALERLHCART